MDVAVLTFQGFNELDSFIASAILNRMKGQGWNVQITCPQECVTSMNGVKVHAQQPLEFANSADVVVVGSGIYTREIAVDEQITSRLSLNPEKQIIAAQCSGTLLLAKLGLLEGLPACTDLTTKPWVIDAGIDVLNQPLVARGNVATAGGCLASSYLAAWIIAKTAGVDAASSAIEYVAPTGEKQQSVAAMRKVIEPYL